MTIEGKRFGENPIVSLGGVTLELVTHTSTKIVAKLPILGPGTYSMLVYVDNLGYSLRFDRHTYSSAND